MQGLSERKYAAHAGLSRGAIQKAKAAGRLVLFADGSIDAAASDKKRAAMTDPSKQRGAARGKLKPVPDAALSAVGEKPASAVTSRWATYAGYRTPRASGVALAAHAMRFHPLPLVIGDSKSVPVHSDLLFWKAESEIRVIGRP